MMGVFYWVVASVAGCVERAAERVREWAGLRYILGGLGVAPSDAVEISFEELEPKNPDWVIVRGRRGKMFMGLVAARASVDDVVAEIRRTLTAGDA